MTNLQFPPDFRWGTATAAYQIEGAAHEDGRGQTIWDTFSHEPGRVVNGDTGDVACDHYHRWRDDIALMQQLHSSIYRFSIAWSRVLPDGRGAVNPAGIDWYSRLVDDLLAAGITPFVTLYHWDLPQALQDDDGGWLRRGIADDFAHYADVVSRALGDRVKHWITINEPWCIAWLGHQSGVHAPGIQTDDPALALRASHHVLLAHAAAVPVLRANVPDAKVGITLNFEHVDPATPVPHDMEAAARYDSFFNRWYLEPVLLGHYPPELSAYYGAAMPKVEPGDMAQIAAPLDFLGVNYYFRSTIAADGHDPVLGCKKVNPIGFEYTAMGWQVYPHGLYALLRRFHDHYPALDLYITENGAAFDDRVSEDGEVHDEQRVSFLRRHFEAVSHAIHDGVPVKGYFVWSLLDNFEWAEGYTKRFGITYVDFETQGRILKDSGKFLAQMAAH